MLWFSNLSSALGSTFVWSQRKFWAVPLIDSNLWQDEQEYNSAREDYYDTSFKPKCTSYYGGDDTPVVDNRPVDYYWTEPKQKDPGADYKPGKFKYLDEAIKNTKKDD